MTFFVYVAIIIRSMSDIIELQSMAAPGKATRYISAHAFKYVIYVCTYVYYLPRHLWHVCICHFRRIRGQLNADVFQPFV